MDKVKYFSSPKSELDLLRHSRSRENIAAGSHFEVAPSNADEFSPEGGDSVRGKLQERSLAMLP